MKYPLSIEELKDISKKLNLDPKDFVRTTDSAFQDLNMAQYLDDNQKMFELISENMSILERPLVLKGNKGIVARPPERIIEFLNLN